MAGNRSAGSSQFQPTAFTYSHQLENLEQRKMLTTLLGGDIFDYYDVNGQHIRVTVKGDAMVELIGAQAQGATLRLDDLPGTWFKSDLGRTGRRYLADGVTYVSTTPINDAIVPAATRPWQTEGVADINILALASEADGDNYGFNRVTVDQAQIIQLVKVGTDTVVAHLQSKLPLDAGKSKVTEISGAAFNPDDGLLYFVAGISATGGGTTADHYEIYSVDVNAGDSTDIANTVALKVTLPSNVVPRSLSFDNTAAAARCLMLAAYKKDGSSSEIDSVRVVTVDLTDESLVSSFPISLNSVDITNVAGLELVEDNPNTNATFAFAVQTGPLAKLLQINLNTGVAEDYGSLRDFSDKTEPFRGLNLQGLSWNPLLQNPFTGTVGVLLATDATTDELVAIDARYRGSGDLFSVYVSHASAGASISIAALNVTETGEYLVPFSGVGEDDEQGYNSVQETSGAAYDLQIDPAWGSENIIKFDSGVGGVYIGARLYVTRDDNSTETEPLRPIINGSLLSRLGLRAAGIDDNADASGNVSAGIVVAPSLLNFVSTQAELVDRLLTANIDQVGGLAIKRDGNAIVAIDTDRIDRDGNVVGDELAFINPGTGHVTDTPLLIKSSVDNSNMIDVQGVAFGDLDFSGDEKLYAIYDGWLGDINTSTGIFTPRSDLTALLGGQAVVGLAFAPFGYVNAPYDTQIPAGPHRNVQAMFIATDDGHLYEVEYVIDANTIITGVDAIHSFGVMNVVGDVLNVGSIMFGPDGRLYAQDVDGGRLVDVNYVSANDDIVNAGSQVLTQPGSLRPTVGGMAYDAYRSRFLAVDNATGETFLGSTLENDFTNNGDPPGASAESAALMVFRGVTTTTNQGQNINNILIGGRVTGRVNLSGSVNTFYAGAILTGQTFGQEYNTSPEVAENFKVGGDIRNLITSASIGTNITPEDLEEIQYFTGFDMVVGGQIGQIKTQGTFAGTVHAQNLGSAPKLSASVIQQEFEQRFQTTINPNDDAEVIKKTDISNFFEDFQILADNGLFYNDTAASAQYLGTLRGNPGQKDFVYVSGTLDAWNAESSPQKDVLDYYAVALLAGQIITVDLDIFSDNTSVVLGVFDPDGRLIANDYDPHGRVHPAMRFRADRPGVYSFAIGVKGDVNFNGVRDEGEEETDPNGPVDYVLRIDDVETMAIGGIVSATHLLNASNSDNGELSFSADSGDIGALVAGQNLVHFANTTIQTLSGDLRAMKAAEIGFHNKAGKEVGYPVLNIAGNVGLLQSTTDRLLLGRTDVTGDIQIVDAKTLYVGRLFAGGGIGTIRAGQMTEEHGFASTSFFVNVDGIGADGTIDFIDVEGDFGTLDGGGPRISTGLGGNVRYIRVGGNIFQDKAFQASGYQPRTLNPGESFTQIDDSGTQFQITPGSSKVTDINNVVTSQPGTLTVTRYGIYGSGGSVLVDVTSTIGGLSISGLASIGAGRAEISRITLQGTGRAVLGDGSVSSPLILDAAALNDINVNITGSYPIDVFDIAGDNINVTTINNTTGGEIVGTTLGTGTIGTLSSHGTIGLAARNTEASIVPRIVVSDIFPFNSQRFGVVSGNILTVKADQGLGNLIVAGSIGPVTANADNKDTAGVFEGIAAAVFASGNIKSVQIGEGVAPSGSGNLALAGIFAKGTIGAITNQGLGSDIQGDIVATGGISSITLSNGSIIDAEITCYDDLADSRNFPKTILSGADIGPITLSGKGGILGAIIYAVDIGNVSVIGGGFGMMNSLVSATGAGTIGNVTVDGFGAINTYFLAGSSMGNLTMTGKGQMLWSTAYSSSVRLSENYVNNPLFYHPLSAYNDLHLALGTPTADVLPGNVEVGDVFTITLADGSGASDSISFTATQATVASVVLGLRDAWIQKALTNALFALVTPSVNGSQLHLAAQADNAAFLITVKTTNGGVANTQTLKLSSNRQAGLISNVKASGNENLGAVSAYRIKGIGLDPLYASTFNFASSIKSITVLPSIDIDPSTITNVSVVTGKLDTLTGGGSISVLNMTVAGIINIINIKGDLLDNSSITASGPSGIINSINVVGNIDGSITASSRIGKIIVGGALTGDIRADGLNVGKYNTLDLLQLQGALTGSVIIQGNAGIITSVGDLGIPGGQLNIGGNLNTLRVGKLTSANASSLAMNVVVVGNLSLLDVVGSIDGAVTIGGDLLKLILRAHPSAIGTTILANDLVVGRDLKSASLTDGNVDTSAISIGRQVGTFLITNGDFAADASLTSIFGSITSFTVKGGDILGDISAPNGRINTLTISGSDLAGLISAASAGTIKLDGSIQNGGRIEILDGGNLDSLTVGQNVASDSDGISVDGLLKTLTVGGNLDGLLEIGQSSALTTIVINGDWNVVTGTQIDSDASITVKGDLNKAASDARLILGADIKTLTVAGNAIVDLLVQGSAGPLQFATLDQSVITIGFNLTSLTITGAVSQTLIQIGISAGQDHEFAAVASDKQADELSRMGNIGLVKAGSIVSAIIAAGGNIQGLNTTSMTDSVVASGLSLGSAAVGQVLEDTLDLSLLADRKTALSGTDRQLFRGDVGTVVFTGGGLFASVISAGVDPGASGDFASPSVITSSTGGSSKITSITATLDGDSMLVSDAPITTNKALGGTVIQGTDAGVSYDPTTDLGGVFPAVAGTAQPGAPYIDGVFTITISGPAGATVTVYDDATGDTTIPVIVVSGTTSASTLTITGAAYTIQRILTADDATLGTLNFNGEIAGDGTDAIDLWIDGSVNNFIVNQLGDDMVGQVGGDVGSMNLTEQGASRLVVGGTIKTLTIASSTTNPFVQELGSYTDVFTSVSVNNTNGQIWAYVDGQLKRVDPAIDESIAQTLSLTDAYSGDPVTLLSHDFLNNSAYAIARLYDPNPSQQVGNLGLALNQTARGLASNSAGRLFTVTTITGGYDQLEEIDPLTGAKTVIGTLRDPLSASKYQGHLLAMTFDNSGRLIALVSDRDGVGVFDDAAVSLVEIQTTAVDGYVSVGRIGSVNAFKGRKLYDTIPTNTTTDSFTALAVQPGTGTIYAMRRDTIGQQDVLVSIDPANGAITEIGNVAIGVTKTEIIGMGFDDNGNLVALDKDALASHPRLIYLSSADLTGNDPAAFELLNATNFLNDDLDVFAISRKGFTSGNNFRTYALDNVVAGDNHGQLWSNPVDAADATGRVAVLGTIDMGTGAFTRLSTIADESGVPISVGPAQYLSLAADDVNNQLYFTTPDNRLIKYDVAGESLTVVGTLTDTSTNTAVTLASIEFNELTGELIGVDKNLSRLVRIDVATAKVYDLGAGKVVSNALADIAFDSAANAGQGQFLGFDSTNTVFQSFRGIDPSSAGGITASSFTNMTVNGAYAGRVTATGNSFGSVAIKGAFSGLIETYSTIGSLTVTGEVSGSVYAGDDVTSVTITGNVVPGASIRIDGKLSSYKQTGNFAGSLRAQELTSAAITGNVDATGSLVVTGPAGSVNISGNFAGDASLESVTNLQIGGKLTSTSQITLAGAATTIAIKGGTDAGSLLLASNSVKSLTVGLTHRGVIGIRLGLSTGTLFDVNTGLISVGLETTSFKVTRDTVSGLFSFGTWIGDDGIYNTADDLITGGTLGTANFGRRYENSVVAVGVLPTQDAGTWSNSFDNRFFVGDTDEDTGSLVDSAQAGGVLRSTIGKLTIKGPILNTNPVDGRIAVITAADSLGTVVLPNTGSDVFTRIYGDPFGAPTVVSSAVVAGNTIRVVFSELLDTSTLVLSTVEGDDGTIIVRKDGQVVTGLTMLYSTQTLADGTVQGILSISGGESFSGTISLTLKGQGDPQDVFILDRTGNRSSWSDIVDPLESILDGDSDGTFGGNYEILLVLGNTA